MRIKIRRSKRIIKRKKLIEIFDICMKNCMDPMYKYKISKFKQMINEDTKKLSDDEKIAK